MELPKCLRCGIGVLVPLSDEYWTESGSIGLSIIGMWVCSNPDCYYKITPSK